MKEYELCIDVPIQPGDAERFKVILQRLKTRVPVQLGGVYDQEKGRNVKLYGGERKVLTDMASRSTNGRRVIVDGVTPNGINVSAITSPKEFQRVTADPSYNILAIIEREDGKPIRWE